MLTLAMLLALSSSPVPQDSIHAAWVAGPGAQPCAKPPVSITFTTAVHLGKGWLAAPIGIFKGLHDDMSKDDRVCVIDGDRVVEGRLVDTDMPLRLALIRADGVRSPGIRPDDGAGAPMAVIGLDARSLRPPFPVTSIQLRPCQADFAEMLKKDHHLICGDGEARYFTGGAALDARGRMAGFMSTLVNGRNMAGPDGPQLRAFVDMYFRSWGKTVPQNLRPWKTK